MMWMITKDQLERMIEIRQYVDIALLAQKTLLIEEFLDDLQKYINYCNEWDYNIAKPLWEIREKWEQRKTK